MYKVTYEIPAGAKGPVKVIPISYEGDIHFASAMCDAIFEVLKSFADLDNKTLESRKRVIPDGFVLEIYSPRNTYRDKSGSLYGRIKCEEI